MLKGLPQFMENQIFVRGMVEQRNGIIAIITIKLALNINGPLEIWPPGKKKSMELCSGVADTWICLWTVHSRQEMYPMLLAESKKCSWKKWILCHTLLIKNLRIQKSMSCWRLCVTTCMRHAKNNNYLEYGSLREGNSMTTPRAYSYLIALLWRCLWGDNKLVIQMYVMAILLFGTNKKNMEPIYPWLSTIWATRMLTTCLLPHSCMTSSSPDLPLSTV